MVGLVFIFRGIDISTPRLPADIAYRVRNLSAQESDWQVATTAVPGDVLEHFALVRLPAEKELNLRNLSIKVNLGNQTEYRADTLVSSSRGINANTDAKLIKTLFDGSGLSVNELKPGEFIDIKWQTRFKEDITFAAAPIVATNVSVSADNYKTAFAKSIATISSTQARSPQATAKDRVFVTQIYGMNPRVVYDDLGGGALIAGADLEGVKGIRIAENKQALVWRLISNDLIEAGLPAKLVAGNYHLEFINKENLALKDKVGFAVMPSYQRAVVTSATPNTLENEKNRIVVLQGVHLNDNVQFTLKNGKIYALENIKLINDRVLSAEIPSNITKGEYRIAVDERDQGVKLVIK